MTSYQHLWRLSYLGLGQDPDRSQIGESRLIGSTLTATHSHLDVVTALLSCSSPSSSTASVRYLYLTGRRMRLSFAGLSLT